MLKRITLALVIGLVLRLAIAVALPGSIKTNDSVGYLRIAENMIAGHGYSLDTDPPYRPSLDRVPTYPLFVASVFIVSGGSERALIAAHVLLELGTILLIFLSARRRFGEEAAFVAALLYAGLPFIAGSGLKLASEPIATFSVALAAYAHTRALDARARFLWLALSGLAWAAAMLARPYLAPLVLVAGLVLLYELRVQGEDTKTRGLAFVTLAAAAAIGISPWALRNFSVAHARGEGPVLFQVYAGGMYERLYSPELLAWLRSYDEPFFWDDPRKPPRAHFLDQHEADEVNALWQELAQKQMTATPDLNARFAALTEQRYRLAPLRLYLWRPISMALKLWFSPRTSALRLSSYESDKLERSPLWLTAALFLLNSAFSLLALVGMVRHRRSAHAHLLWSLPLAVTLILVAFGARETRCVAPMFPLIAVAAALGLEQLRIWRKA